MAVKGSLGRAVQHIQIGTAHAILKRERQNAELGLQEIDLQYHLPISGTALPTPAFASVELNFEWEFHYAPNQRDSELEVPHVLVGSYVPHGGPVHLSAHVDRWQIDPDHDGITGARVQMGVLADVERIFNGYLHLNIQGYAQSRDSMQDNPDQEVGE